MNAYKLYVKCKFVLSYVLSLTSFPLTCISCGSQSYGIILCKKCLQEFLQYYCPVGNRCSICGIQLISEKELCLDCRTDESKDEAAPKNISKKILLKDIQSIFPIHHYSLWKKDLLFSWKMANNRALTPVFAKLAFKILQEHYKDITVVPVPPRQGKIKKNGWDQIDELCSCLQGFYGVKIDKVLVRLTRNEQKKRSRKERIEGLEKNYALASEQINVPKEVVIIDDIMTTGATLESCAKALKSGGATIIHALTLFYV